MSLQKTNSSKINEPVGAALARHNSHVGVGVGVDFSSVLQKGQLPPVYKMRLKIDPPSHMDFNDDGDSEEDDDLPKPLRRDLLHSQIKEAGLKRKHQRRPTMSDFVGLPLLKDHNPEPPPNPRALGHRKSISLHSFAGRNTGKREHNSIAEAS